MRPQLLGLIKHLAGVELGCFGHIFARPFEDPSPWLEDEAEPNVDMWATPAESREEIVGLYHRAWEHADVTISTLALDSMGRVPWWSAARRDVSLHRILVHVIAETHRHSGHADVVRELIDGATGLQEDNDNMAPGDQAWWQNYHNR
ncbi:MAG: DinB family protein [Pseudonocardiaceae bacterium]